MDYVVIPEGKTDPKMPHDEPTASVDLLPTEILCRIFELCDIKSKLSVVQVSRKWRSVAHGEKRMWAVDVNAVYNAAYSHDGPADPEDGEGDREESQVARIRRGQFATKLMRAVLTQATLANAVSVTSDCMASDSGEHLTLSSFAARWQPIASVQDLYFASSSTMIADSFLSFGYGLDLERTEPVSQPGLNSNEESFTDFPDDDSDIEMRHNLGCIWTHTREKRAPTLTTADLARTEAMESEAFEEICRRKGWSIDSQQGKWMRDRFFIFRTFFSTETNCLRSQIFSTCWGNMQYLILTLPGSSYHYLPILQHTPQIAALTLCFTSPPILPTDDIDSPLPGGYPGDRAISLKALRDLTLDFINNSFIHPSSQKFIDAIQCGDRGSESEKLKEMTFNSDHLKTWPFHSTPPKAYLPLQKFIAAYGSGLKTFCTNMGPDLPRSLLLKTLSSTLGEEGYLREVALWFPCTHPRQFNDPKSQDRQDLSSLLYEIIDEGYDYKIRDLIIGHSVSEKTLKSQLRELENFIKLTMCSARGIRWRHERTITVSLKVLHSGGSRRKTVRQLEKTVFDLSEPAFDLESCVKVVKVKKGVKPGKRDSKRKESCDCCSRFEIGTVEMTFSQRLRSGPRFCQIECFERPRCIVHSPELRCVALLSSDAAAASAYEEK